MHYAVLSDCWRVQRKIREEYLPDFLVERLAKER